MILTRTDQNMTLDELYEEHVKWGDLFAQLFKPYTHWKVQKTTGRPLKIGYLSADFFVHSVSYFVEALLTYHDASRCQTIWYYLLN